MNELTLNSPFAKDNQESEDSEPQYRKPVSPPEAFNSHYATSDGTYVQITGNPLATPEILTHEVASVAEKTVEKVDGLVHEFGDAGDQMQEIANETSQRIGEVMFGVQDAINDIFQDAMKKVDSLSNAANKLTGGDKPPVQIGHPWEEKNR